MPAAIRVEDVSKRFRLYHERYQTLKERSSTSATSPTTTSGRSDDIDLEIEEGSTVGLLGAQRLGEVDAAEVHRRHPAAERGEHQGAGPHRRAARARRRLPLRADRPGEHLPQRLHPRHVAAGARPAGSTRSSPSPSSSSSSTRRCASTRPGMYVRLGFAIAVNVDPDILLIDEVLAVGDEAFQRKCLERIRAFQREGRTIVLVTHAVESVRQICDVAAVLDRGQLVAHGTPGEAIRTYREQLLDRAARTGGDRDRGGGGLGADDRRRAPVPHRPGAPAHARHPHHRGAGPVTPERRRTGVPAARRRPRRAGEVRVEARHRRRRTSASPSPTSRAASPSARTCGCSASAPRSSRVRARSVFHLPRIPLLDGTYMITIGVTSYDEGVVYDWSEARHEFEVMNPGGLPRLHPRADRDRGGERVAVTADGRDGRGHRVDEPAHPDDDAVRPPRIMAEIQVEARRLRREGVVSPAFERELDVAFGRLAPPAASEDFDADARRRPRSSPTSTPMSPSSPRSPAVPRSRSSCARRCSSTASTSPTRSRTSPRPPPAPPGCSRAASTSSRTPYRARHRACGGEHAATPVGGDGAAVGRGTGRPAAAGPRPGAASGSAAPAASCRGSSPAASTRTASSRAVPSPTTPRPRGSRSARTRCSITSGWCHQTASAGSCWSGASTGWAWASSWRCSTPPPTCSRPAGPWPSSPRCARPTALPRR